MTEKTHTCDCANCNLCVACAVIGSSSFKNTTQDQLMWLYCRLRYPEDISDVVDEAKMTYGITARTVRKRLDQLAELGL